MFDKCENQQEPEWERVEEKGEIAVGPDYVKNNNNNKICLYDI